MPFMILHDVILARNKNDRQGVAVGAWAGCAGYSRGLVEYLRAARVKNRGHDLKDREERPTQGGE